MIQQDDEIRLKIVGTRVDAAGIVSRFSNLFLECEEKISLDRNFMLSLFLYCSLPSEL